MKNITVVAAVIEKDNLFLATQRGYGEFKGKWEFPGGKVEINEDREEALKREIKEELNSEINIRKFLCTVEYDYINFHLTMHCYLCNLVDDKFTLIEHQDYKWISKDNLETIDWLEADVFILNYLKEDKLWKKE